MNKVNNKGFSLIELLVAIFIFSMGIVSVFSLIVNTINLNDYNKNYVIATSLAREQIELIKNIRDSNYKKVQIYNQIIPSSNNHNDVFEFGKYYKIENDFSDNAVFPIKVSEIENFVIGDGEFINEMNEYKVCINEKKLYTYDCKSENKETVFFKYIKIDELKYFEDGKEIIITDALKVTSKVVWLKKGFKEFEITYILTDYKRF